MFEDFLIKSFEDKYYEDLNKTYFEVFERNFLTKNQYSKRFKNGKCYTSFLLIKKDSNSIVGHIGFKLNNLNSQLKGKIAFRYSTFISSEYRGTGLYKYFMDKIKILLFEKFDVKVIFAWPNKQNLISCLKDCNYYNQSPILTWQHKLGKNNYNNHYLQGYNFEDFLKNNIKLEIINKENKLTLDSFEDLKTILFNRFNKKYKIIFKEKCYSIIGESKIDEINYLSIVFIQGFNINNLISILHDIYKGDNYIVQIWCDPKDRYFLRSLLKTGFLPNGPIFYNGIYLLDQKTFLSQDYFPSMYNHDAF